MILSPLALKAKTCFSLYEFCRVDMHTHPTPSVWPTPMAIHVGVPKPPSDKSHRRTVRSLEEEISQRLELKRKEEKRENVRNEKKRTTKKQRRNVQKKIEVTVDKIDTLKIILTFKATQQRHTRLRRYVVKHVIAPFLTSTLRL